MLLLNEAWPLAEKIAEYLRSHPAALEVTVAGSVRRRLECVAEIDIVAASRTVGRLLDYTLTLPGIQTILERDGSSIHLLLNIGMELHVYGVKPEDYFPVLYFHTGSTEHIRAIAALARQLGFVLDCQGLRTAAGRRLAITSEQELCRCLNIGYIEPELREGLFETARAGQANEPLLVTAADIQGGLHIHTRYSDGTDNIASLVQAAQSLGWTYLGIADHSQSAAYAGGLSPAAVLKQRREIDQLNHSNAGFTVLAGIESDIKPDGSLDYDDDILARFDFVVASVHSAFRQDERTMTARIMKAMSNRYVSILGHPTGRILLKRPGYALDLPAIIDAAAQTGTILEINCNPRRLDLDWRWHRQAKAAGLLFAINPDAHSTAELQNIRYGVAAARKGALTAADIVNTCDSQTLRSMLRRKRSSE